MSSDRTTILDLRDGEAPTRALPRRQARIARAAPPHDGGRDRAGRVLAGRYELRRLIGAGGMASVYEGFDLRLQREVAIKLVDVDGGGSPAAARRFEREAKLAAAVRHPGVVAVWDGGVDGAERFIVMERVHGSTLAELLRDGPLPRERAIAITIGMCEALQAAHDRGLVHRDIKTGNVMVTAQGAVKIVDFGVARADAATPLTQAHDVIGTARTLSPEQARGARADARSDVYAVGCVLYELLTGRPPFRGEVAAAVIHQHVSCAPEPPSRVRGTVPVALDAPVLRALAKDPAARYQSASEFGRALAGVTLIDAPAPTPRPAPRTRRTALRRASAATALLAAFALLALALLASPSAPRPKAHPAVHASAGRPASNAPSLSAVQTPPAPAAPAPQTPVAGEIPQTPAGDGGEPGHDRHDRGRGHGKGHGKGATGEGDQSAFSD